jgi:hypothetical protein
MYCNNEKNTTLNISFCSLNLLRTLMMFCVWPSGNNMLLKMITQLYLWKVSFTYCILLIQPLRLRTWWTRRIGFQFYKKNNVLKLLQMLYPRVVESH